MVLSSFALAFQSANTDAIDAYVKAQMDTQHIPGLALLVVKDGKVYKERAYGVANIESNRPVQTTDRFDIGSIGKTFTATMIMQLVDQGKLKLGQTVHEILPDLPEKWKPITIRQLLSHQSGLPDYALVPTVGLMDTYDQPHWKDVMYKLNLDFPSGKLYQYSNTNFVMLGMILEKVAGEDYRSLVKKRIFGPVGMNDTTFKEVGKGLPSGSATGYFYNEGKLEDGGPGGVSPMPSDGGEFSTVYDLRKWYEAVRGGKVLKTGIVHQMQTPSRVASGRGTAYGLGWMTNKIEGSPQITHGGNSVGFSGTLSSFPKQHLEIYMLCNLYPVGGDGFAAGIARLMEPSLRSKPQKASADPNPELTSKLIAGLKDLAKGNTKATEFHEDMQLRLATGRGKMAQSAFVNFDDVEKVEFISKRNEKPDTVVRYRVFDAKTSWIVDFQVTKEGTIYSIGKNADLDKQ